VLAGGAMELVAWPERLLCAVAVSSTLVAPVELRGGAAALCAVAFLWRRAARLPRAGGHDGDPGCV
jgi:hypothetical protein